MNENSLKDSLIPSPFDSQISNIKIGKNEIDGNYYHEVRFETSQSALAFYQMNYENPKKGIRIDPAMNKLETNTHLTIDEAKIQIQNGTLIEGKFYKI